MYQLPHSAVVGWVGALGDFYVPNMLDLVCPLCRNAVTFKVEAWDEASVRGRPLRMRCPRCSGSVNLLRLGGKPYTEVRLFIDAEQPGRGPVRGFHLISDEALSPRVKKAYQSALRVFAIGEADSTAVQCRRVLEGMLHASYRPT